MDKPVVYYFSGTGNSLYLAKELSKKLDGEMIAIASTLHLGVVQPVSGVVGIVYPVYFNDLPVIVRDFAQKLRGIENSYVFAVSNYGGCGSQSVKSLGEIIGAAGGALSAAFGIHMPQDAFLKPWENNDRLIEKARVKVERLAQDIKAQKKGLFLKGLLNWVFVRIHHKLLPSIRANLSKRAELPPDADLGVLVRSSDKAYIVGDTCKGCGVCATVCPVGNIEIRNAKPAWLHQCENCLACYEWCPAKAIEGTVASKGYYYINPKINISEMIAQKD